MKSKNKPKEIRLKLNDYEHAAIGEMAAAAKMKVTDFCRRRLMGEPALGEQGGQYREIKHSLTTIKNNLEMIESKDQIIEARREIYVLTMVLYRLVLTQYKSFNIELDKIPFQDKNLLQKHKNDLDSLMKQFKRDAIGKVS